MIANILGDIDKGLTGSEIRRLLLQANIEDLSIIIEIEKVLGISDKFHYYNSRFMNQTAVVQINTRKDAQREVFESTEYCDVIEYRPKDRILVQDDQRTFYE